MEDGMFLKDLMDMAAMTTAQVRKNADPVESLWVATNPRQLMLRARKSEIGLKRKKVHDETKGTA